MAEAIRAAMMLSSTIPDLSDETKALAGDLEKLGPLRASIAKERDDLTRSAADLALDKTRLTALIDARQQSLADAESALDAERKRARRTRGPGRQSQRFDRQHGEPDRRRESRRRRRARGRPGDRRRGRLPRRRDARGDPARLKPAIAFADAKGQSRSRSPGPS